MSVGELGDDAHPDSVCAGAADADDALSKVQLAAVGQRDRRYRRGGRKRKVKDGDRARRGRDTRGSGRKIP